MLVVQVDRLPCIAEEDRVVQVVLVSTVVRVLYLVVKARIYLAVILDIFVT